MQTIRNAPASSTKVHSPEESELSQAVLEAMKKNPFTTSVKEIRLQVLKEHKDWEVSARKINQLVKQTKKNGKTPLGTSSVSEANDTSSAPGLRQRMSLRLNQVLKRKKDVGSTDVASKAAILTELPVEQEEEPVSDSFPGTEVYEDDNDGKKDEKCCEGGCVIL